MFYWLSPIRNNELTFKLNANFETYISTTYICVDNHTGGGRHVCFTCVIPHLHIHFPTFFFTLICFLYLQKLYKK